MLNTEKPAAPSPAPAGTDPTAALAEAVEAEVMDVWDPQVKVEENAHNWKDEPVLVVGDRSRRGGGPAHVDLFSGCGGFSCGFESVGFETVVGLDIHQPSHRTFAANHAGASTILGDIRRAPDSMLREAVGKADVVLVTAGVPCQGFSLCNRKRHDNDERNFLFLEFIRAVRLFQPPYVLLENVSGLRSSGEGKFERAICEAISESGYEVQPRMFNALEFGVPQKRTRVVFQGARPGYKIRWPRPMFGSRNLSPVRTVADALSDLPALENAEIKNEYELPPQTEYQRIMRARSTRLLNHEAPNHPAATIDKIRNTKPGSPMYPKFKQRIRLKLDEPSPTQVSGGIRPQFSFGHPTQPRGLSIRERCRIQSFPDHYEIFGGIVQGRVQTGNAVPPLLAAAIGQEIRKGLDRLKEPEEEVEKVPLQLGLSF